MRVVEVRSYDEAEKMIKEGQCEVAILEWEDFPPPLEVGGGEIRLPGDPKYWCHIFVASEELAEEILSRSRPRWLRASPSPVGRFPRLYAPVRACTAIKKLM